MSATRIELRPSSNFSANGRLHGTIAAFDVDSGAHTGWEETKDWSRRETLKKVAEDLAQTFERPASEMLALLTAAVRAARSAQDGGSLGEHQDVSGSQADRLLKYVEQESPTLFVDQYGEPYIAPRGDGTEVNRINSRATRRWLAHLMDEAEAKAPSGEALQGAILTMESRAERSGIRHTLDVRTAWRDGVVWHDLGEAAVRITAGGWEIVDRPPILFRRFQHQHPQVTPLQGGDYTLLRRYLRLDEEDDRILTEVSIITDFTSDIPVVGKDFYGAEGSGKTTTARVCVNLVDPSMVPTIRRIPKQDEITQRFEGWRVSAFDNAGDSYPDWLQDSISAAITGDGEIRRELYTTKDTSVMAFMRSLVITGINVPLTRPDALDRFVLLRLARIPESERMPIDDFWRAFDADRASILGGAFDVLARALAILPSVHLAGLPRMADWARLGYAVAEALGYGGPRFIAAYEANHARRQSEAIAADLVAQAVLILTDQYKVWTGTPTQLKSLLDEIARRDLGVNFEDKRKAAEVWPVDTTRLGQALTRLASTLEASGVSFTRDTVDRKRIYSLQKFESPDQQTAEIASPASQRLSALVETQRYDANDAEFPTQGGKVEFSDECPRCGADEWVVEEDTGREICGNDGCGELRP